MKRICRRDVFCMYRWNKIIPLASCQIPLRCMFPRMPSNLSLRVLCRRSKSFLLFWCTWPLWINGSMKKGQCWSSSGHFPYVVILQVNLQRVYNCSGLQANNPTSLSEFQKNCFNNKNGQKWCWDSEPNMFWQRVGTALLWSALLLATLIFAIT